MNKVAQCMVKAAQLRAQADKLEKVALLLDDSDEITGADLGIGAGALGLLGGGAYGVNKLMKNRAAAEAAAQAAQAALAAKAAQKSRLLKGALGLSGLGATLGAGAYGYHRYAKNHEAKTLEALVRGMGGQPGGDYSTFLQSIGR